MSGPQNKAILGLLLTAFLSLSLLIDAAVPKLSPAILFTALSIVLLEISGPSHRFLGQGSTSFPCCLFLALLPGSSTSLAGFVILVALLIRSVLKSRRHWTWLAWEFVIDAVATLGSLLVLKLVLSYQSTDDVKFLFGLAVVCVFYIMSRPVLFGFWTSLLPVKIREQWEEDLANVSVIYHILGLMALPYALASENAQFFLLAPLGPFLCARSVRVLWDSHRDPARLNLIYKLENVETNLSTTQEENIRLESELDHKESDFAFLKELAKRLPHQTHDEEVIRELVRLANKAAFCDTAAYFEVKNDNLNYVYSEPRLREVRPPTELMMRAFRGKSIERSRKGNSADLLGQTDSHSLAVPIPRYGVLYLGRRNPQTFQRPEVSRLIMLSQQALFALRGVEYLAAKEQALQSESEQRKEVELLLSDMTGLVKVMDDLIKLEDPREILETAGQSLPKLFDTRNWLFQLDSEPGRVSSETGKWDWSLVQTLTQQAVEAGLPLTERDLKALKYPPPIAQAQSVLICPLQGDRGALGALFLAHDKRNAFQLRHQRLLLALCFQLSSHFSNTVLRDRIHKAHTDLEHTHAQLKDSQAQVIQSSKLAAVGRLAAGIAHEFNSPLGAMRLSLESASLSLKKKPERAESKIKRSLESIERLSEIVSKLLFYSREGAVKSQPVCPNALVEDTVKVIQGQLNQASVSIELNLGEVPEFKVNQSEIQQCLMNLVTNSIESMAKKDGSQKRIEISTALEGEEVILSVKDDGIGLSPEVQEKAFDPFFTTKDIGQGEGLGLSVVKQLISKHKGGVEFQTTPGEGARFDLHLPVARS